MRVIQINTVCATGSTGCIAAELFQANIISGNESYFAYGRGNAPSTVSNSYKIGTLADFGFHVLKNFFQGESGFGSTHRTKLFLSWLDTIKPDIIHLHNIHGFYINIELLFTYIKEKSIPVVWTLHDCWSFTGHCAHFDYIACKKWHTQCHHCPQYRSSYPYALFRDNSKNNYLRKKSAFQKVSNLTIVTPSYWLRNLVKNSFLKEYPIEVIANGIDLQVFYHRPSSDLYISSFIKQHKLQGKKIILGVANVWTAKKGLDYFKQLTAYLDDSYRILLVGANHTLMKNLQNNYSKKIIPIARTQNPHELAALYSLALVYVNPTLEDTFPTTNLEALACSTPVITFQTGGSPESLTPSCGITIPKGNIQQMADAIINLNNSRFTQSACRNQALNYDKNKQYPLYIALYKKIVSGKESVTMT